MEITSYEHYYSICISSKYERLTKQPTLTKINYLQNFSCFNMCFFGPPIFPYTTMAAIDSSVDDEKWTINRQQLPNIKVHHFVGMHVSVCMCILHDIAMLWLQHKHVFMPLQWYTRDVCVFINQMLEPTSIHVHTVGAHLFGRFYLVPSKCLLNDLFCWCCLKWH